MKSVQPNQPGLTGVIKRCKCIVLGAPGVGKTAIVRQFLGPPATFPKRYLMTAGVELSLKSIKVQKDAILEGDDEKEADKVLELFIFDFSGRFDLYGELIKRLWSKDVNLIIGVFDVNSEESFAKLSQQLTDCLKQMKSPEEISGIIIGNKVELSENRAVRNEEAHQLARKFKMRFFDLSAKNSRSQVEEAFLALATNFLDVRTHKE